MVWCAKCGSSQEDTSLTFHRFPQPSMYCSLKAQVWALYCFPEVDWSEYKSLDKLYRSHKSLCSIHFDESSFVFTSNGKKRLNKFAIPTDARGILAKLRNQNDHRDVKSFNDDSDTSTADVEAEVITEPPDSLDRLESVDAPLTDDDDNAESPDTNLLFQSFNDDSKTSTPDVEAEVMSEPPDALGRLESVDAPLTDDDDNAESSDTNAQIQNIEPRKIKKYKSIIKLKHKKIQRLQSQISHYERKITELEKASEAKQESNATSDHVGFDD